MTVIDTSRRPGPRAAAIANRWGPPGWTIVALSQFLGLLKDILFPGHATTPSPTAGPATEDGTGRTSVLVIDASGSMAETDWKPSRFEAAKSAALAYTTRLACEEPGARVGVVGYGCSAHIACGLTPVGDRHRLANSIRGMDYLGSTNMRAGLKAALQMLQNQPSPCQIVLLTDGHNTERSPRRIAETLKAFATVECVGIGGSPADVDEDLLKEIASHHPDGTKRYRWIGEKEHLVAHFRELAGRITR